MDNPRIKLALGVVIFVFLALLTWPKLLAIWLPLSYIGEPEEARYFATLAVLAVVGAILPLGLTNRVLSKPLSLD